MNMKKTINEIRTMFDTIKTKCINEIKTILADMEELELDADTAPYARHSTDVFSKIVRIRMNEDTNELEMTLDNLDFASDIGDEWTKVNGVNWEDLYRAIVLSLGYKYR